MVLRVDPERPDARAIRAAADIIRRGGLVAFPTETVYGLGADALNPGAVRKIFEAKGRPADNPLIVHVADVRVVYALAGEFPPLARKLARRFWPGPLTLVLLKTEIVPSVTTGGLDTVAIRMPAHPVALALIREAGVPIAAPSANRSGKPSPTTAEHVIEDLGEKVDAVLDAGETRIGVESTVLDLTTDPPTLLRPGGLPLERIEEVVGEVRIHPAVRGKKVDLARAPGMKYRHYAPDTPIVLVEGSPEDVVTKVRELVAQYKNAGKKVGIFSVYGEDYGADVVVFVGSDPISVARRLFSALRELDRANVDVIIAEGVPEEGLGLAVMNRLRKAATQIVRLP